MDDNTHIPHKASLPPVNLPTNGDAPIFEDMKKPEEILPEHNERLMPVRKQAPTKPLIVGKNLKKNFLVQGLTKIKKSVTPAMRPAKMVSSGMSQPLQKSKPAKTKSTPLQTLQPVVTTPEIIEKVAREDNTSSQETLPKEAKSFSSLRTYEDDIARVLKSKNVSVAQIHTEEIKRKENADTKKEEKYILPEKKKRKISWNKVFISLLTILLVLTGIVMISKVFSKTSSESLPAVVSSEEQNPEVRSFFLIDQKTEIPTTNVSKGALLDTFKNIRGGTVGPLGTVSQLYFTRDTSVGSATLTLEETLGILGIQAPASLIRNLYKDFVYGIHVFDGNQPFLVLRTNSYGHAFAGMLEWEQSLERDMKGLIIATNSDNQNKASTTAELLRKHIFKDIIVLNRDARVITNDDGKVLMLYSFTSADTIVITTNEGTLKEIIARLERIRFSR